MLREQSFYNAMVPESSDTNNQPAKTSPRSIFRLLTSIITLVVAVAIIAWVWRYLPVEWPQDWTSAEDVAADEQAPGEPVPPAVATRPDPQAPPAELQPLRQIKAQAEAELRELKHELSLTRTETLLLLAERAFARGRNAVATEYLREAQAALAGLAPTAQTSELRKAIAADIVTIERYAGRSPQRAAPLINALLDQCLIPERPATAASSTLIHALLEYLPQGMREAVTIRKADDTERANEKLLNFLLVARVAALDADREKYLASLDGARRLAERFEKDAAFLAALDALARLDIEWRRPRLRSLQEIYGGAPR